MLLARLEPNKDPMLLTFALTLTLLTALLLHGDDLFLDLYVSFKNLKPKPISGTAQRKLLSRPQRRFALLIPSWQERGLARTMSENIRRMEYSHYSVFFGVYPNDFQAWKEARELEKKFPQVSVIVNDRHGPSSKAQLLNEMLRQILESEESTGLRHDAFLFHDPEDVLHPLSLALLNEELETADLVQLPLLSLPVSWNQLTAGAYADETAEWHTKEFLARASLGASLPNPGAGLALSRTLLVALTSSGRTEVFPENTTAENYQIGLEAGRLGYECRFVSAYRWEEGKRDFIATRKFFPDRPASAIRHKARWAAGIAFQGAARFGWKGNWASRYFLWRDRRGPWTTLFLAGVSGMALLWAFQSDGTPPLIPHWLETLSLLNLFLWLRRVAWRMRTTAWVHGWAYALLVPLRWPVANFVNSLSAWKAFSLYRQSRKSGSAPAWTKRERRLPSFEVRA
jgi:adsorption protein B